MINYLIDFEQKKYPYYHVIGVEILSELNGIIRYKTHICSKLDNKWKKWEPTNEINLSELSSIMRDEKINTILNSGKIISINGPSGCGKTTIAKKMIEKFPTLSFSISATTRAPRFNEINGKDYYFLDIENFMQKVYKDEFIEYQEVYKNIYYGTLKSEIDRIWKDNKVPILDIDVFGAFNLKRIYGPSVIAIFIHPGDIKTLSERLLKRGSDSLEKIQERLTKAEDEISKSAYFDFIVYNNDLDTSVQQVSKIISEFI